MDTVYHGFLTLVHQRLVPFFPSAQAATHFLNDLVEHRHVLSGSFLLQVLYGEEWPDSDIDLYFLAETENSSSFALKDAKDELTVHDFTHKYMKMHQIYGPHVLAYTGMPVRSVLYNIQGGHVPKALNFLQVYPVFHTTNTAGFLYKHGVLTTTFSSIPDYVERTTDMDFLKNVFDGKQIWIHDWNSLLERHSPIESFKPTYSRNEGLSRYCAKRFLHRLENRMLKYSRRGFMFTFEDPFSKQYLEDHLASCNGEKDCFFANDSDVEEPVLGQVTESDCNTRTTRTMTRTLTNILAWRMETKRVKEEEEEEEEEQKVYFIRGKTKRTSSYLN